jgi:lipopolysaccharide/colanic/teichoic acid biosynthesis glycosyltransferase
MTAPQLSREAPQPPGEVLFAWPRRRSRGYAATKRAVDVAGSALLLTSCLPVLLLAALAIRLESKGPVLFGQMRCGRGGRRFRMWKLRTMTHDAEARKQALLHLNEMDGPVFKMRRDPRVTRVGGVLRRLSIDEIPQLWNVLRGEMSLVGPRPPLPEEAMRYSPSQRRRLAVTPGLTGLWQVSGRNELSFEEWVRLDLEYVAQASLALDLRILARTVPAVLRGRGAC